MFCLRLQGRLIGRLFCWRLAGLAAHDNSKHAAQGIMESDENKIK